MNAINYNGPHDVSVRNVPDANIETTTAVLVRVEVSYLL